MSIKNAYLNGVYEDLAARYAEQTEFLEAVHEVLETLVPVVEADPRYEQQNIIGRIVEPERIIMFRVPWVDDQGKVQVNRGYRVQLLRHRPLQGRPALPRQRHPVHHQVPGL